MAFDRPADEGGAEAGAAGLVGNAGAAAFLPVELEDITVDRPADLDRSLAARQRALFGGVGGEFMEDQRDRIDRMVAAGDVGAINDEARHVLAAMIVDLDDRGD